VSDLDRYWDELVTASLLGTDRRDPPPPPPGLLADLVADTLRPDGAARMLAAVAATAAARRAAFVASPPASTLQRADGDDRPWCPASAVDTWRLVVADWPVLEDEWLLAVAEGGWSLPPDALVDLLARHRGDAVRRARVVRAGGPTARWVVEQVPRLGATAPRSVPLAAVTSLPELPITPELQELTSADAHTVSTRLRVGFSSGAFTAAHRAVLVNLLARCRPEVLLDVAEVLAGDGSTLALGLSELARFRHRMLAELSGGAAPTSVAPPR
jgi:hypothetical protein